MKVLAIIPARGGSKGVPGKNIKLLGGKPLIAHAIKCARTASTVSKIVVSTDSDEISKAVAEYGVLVIKRPTSIATDTSSVAEAVRHVYEQLQEHFDVIVLLQPTSPLRTGKDLDRIIALFEEHDELDGVVSVVPFYDTHPARMYTLEEHNYMQSFLKDGETHRRQDLSPVYYRNGCFYAVRTDFFLKHYSLMPEKKIAYVMDEEWLVNIDTPRDFKIAELLYEEWKHENSNY